MTTTRAITLWVGLLAGGLCGRLFAQQPADFAVPATALAFYDRTTVTGCPVGWVEQTAARGFYLVGMPASGTRGTAVGAALTDLENRHHTHSFGHTHTQAHTHTYSITSGLPSSTSAKVGGAGGVSTSTHTHLASGTTSGESAANTGSASTSTSGNESTTITPFLEELVCKKS